MKAIGTKTNGEKIEFEVINGMLSCYNNQLKELVVPQGVTWLYCHNNQLKDNKITWRGQKIETLFADCFTMLVERKHRRGSMTIYKCRYFGSEPLKGLQPCYVAKLGNSTAHGATVDQAVRDLHFKLSERKGVEKLAKQVKKSGYVTREQYRLLTGACEAGINHFCQEHRIKGNRLSVKRVLALTANAYGGERFKELVD